MPRSSGHVFYDRLQAVLIEAGFDTFAETACKPHYAAKMGAPSIPPGRYFRMHMVGYFAVLFLTLLNKAGEALGMDRHLKVNTAKRRTHSLFRQGCVLYDLIPAMPEPRLH